MADHLECPDCGSDWNRALDTRVKTIPALGGKVTQRRRRCLDCQHIWPTYELPRERVHALLAASSEAVARRTGAKLRSLGHQLIHTGEQIEKGAV